MLPNLFSPIKIGNVEIKNRIAMAPMGTMGMVNPDGSLKPTVIDYYAERAKGGVGLIITGITQVERKVVNMPKRSIPLMFWNDASSYGELAERAHAFGCKVFVQLTAGYGRVSRPQYLENAPVSASAIPNVWDPKVICRALEIEEVDQIVKAFGEAAEIVASTGCDGVELHGHEGYLLDQFTTKIWNRRTDKYGGPDLESRSRFPVDIIREIKSRAGKDFPVCYRVGLKHMIKGLNRGALPGEEFEEAGRDLDEGIRLLRILEQEGVDAVHVDKGCYDSWYWAHPPVYMKYGNMIDMAAEAKKAVKVPVIGVGRMDDPELAIQAIEEGKADVVAIGRGLLADPSWPDKVRNGRLEDIRPCLACQYGCMHRLRQRKPLSCSMNPACGREVVYRLQPAKSEKKVLIIGGGVAGMEAARVAALRGHQVRLLEKSDRLGGHLRVIERLTFKYGQERLLKYYLYQMKALPIDIRFNTEGKRSIIACEDFDVLLVATGSKAKVPANIKASNAGSIMTSVEVLRKEKMEIGDKVIVIGGGLLGCEIGLWLRGMGKQVTILEMLSTPLGDGVMVANRQMLLDMLARDGVEIRLNAEVKEVTGTGVVFEGKQGEHLEMNAESIVFATGLEPEDSLYRSLYLEYPNVFALGDCGGGKKIHDAIWSAYGLVREL